MPDIFISYKSDRRGAAGHLAEVLQGFGYAVWWDFSLVPGQNFAAEIDNALRAAKAVVVLWCSLAVRSEWVRHEAALAKKLGSYVPLTIEALSPSDYPVEFGSDDRIDLTDWDGSPRSFALDDILERIGELVGRHPNIDWPRLRKLDNVWKRYGSPTLRQLALETPMDRSQSTGPVLTSKRVLSVGLLPYPPLMDLKDEDTASHQRGDFSGPWVDLFQLVAEQLGLEYEMGAMTAAHLIGEGKATFDVVLGLFKTDRRARSYDFTVPIYRIGLQGVTRADAPMITKEQLARGDLKVVVQEGEVGWEYVMGELLSMRAKKRLYTTNSFTTYEAMDLLKAAPEYNVAIADELSCLHFIKERSGDTSFRLAFARPLQTFDECLGIKRGLGIRMDLLNHALIEARNSSEFLQSEAKSLGELSGSVVERCSLR